MNNCGKSFFSLSLSLSLIKKKLYIYIAIFRLGCARSAYRKVAVEMLGRVNIQK